MGITMMKWNTALQMMESDEEDEGDAEFAVEISKQELVTAGLTFALFLDRPIRRSMRSEGWRLSWRTFRPAMISLWNMATPCRWVMFYCNPAELVLDSSISKNSNYRLNLVPQILQIRGLWVSLRQLLGRRRVAAMWAGWEISFVFSAWLLIQISFFLFSVHFSSAIVQVFGAVIMMHRIYCNRVYLFNPIPSFIAIVLLTQVFA